MDLNSELVKINTDLSTRGIKLRIEQRGKRLNLRGPLPSKDGTGRFISQRISLCINADLAGVKEAERKIQLVLVQLEQNQFNWNYWASHDNKGKDTKELASPQKAIESFKSTFFSDPMRRRSPAGSKSTWTSAYLPYLRRLIEIENELKCDLNADLFCKVLETYSENTRSRQQCATALSALSNHIEIELPKDWKAQANGYGLHKARFRQLPSDNLIIEAYDLIPNPKWKLAYGLMATYGLRNHEIFFCDLSCFSKNGDKILRVLPTTKTGEHQVWPFHPQWVDLFDLDQLGRNFPSLPEVKTDLTKTTLQQVGRRVAEQFRRYKLPITPYDLRHAWAVRTIHIGLPDTVASRMMGHSVAIHTRTYHHWITRRDQQQAVDAALSRRIA